MVVWYRSTTIACGLALMLVGAGNWITGTIRLRENEMVARSNDATAIVGESNSPGSTPAQAESDEVRQVAQSRVDFYHVVASGGRLMVAAGFVLTTAALARYFRPGPRRDRPMR